MRVAVFSTDPTTVSSSSAQTRRTVTSCLSRSSAGSDNGRAGPGCERGVLLRQRPARRPSLRRLQRLGVTRCVALRCAGFNNVDLEAAARLGIAVVRVPAYSPYAVAEHTIASGADAQPQDPSRARARPRGNFALDGLLGFDLHGRTVGIVGTGRIGECFARIMAASVANCSPATRCRTRRARRWVRDTWGSLICYGERHRDPALPADAANAPPDRRGALAMMKPGAMLINTSRGAMVDTPAVIER